MFCLLFSNGYASSELQGQSSVLCISWTASPQSASPRFRNNCVHPKIWSQDETRHDSTDNVGTEVSLALAASPLLSEKLDELDSQDQGWDESSMMDWAGDEGLGQTGRRHAIRYVENCANMYVLHLVTWQKRQHSPAGCKRYKWILCSAWHLLLVGEATLDAVPRQSNAQMRCNVAAESKTSYK